jgi:formylmethanofuran dehydrogenase subunit E
MHQKEIFEKTWWFHGHKCAMVLLGAKAGLYALDLLKAKREDAYSYFGLLEDYSCMADGVQMTSGLTLGSQLLWVHHHFHPSLTVVSKATSKGVKITLKKDIIDEVVKARRERDAIVAKKGEMSPEEFKKKITPKSKVIFAIADKYTDTPYEELFKVEKVQKKWKELAKTPFSVDFHDVHGVDHHTH